MSYKQRRLPSVVKLSTDATFHLYIVKLTVRGCGFSVFSFKGGWALNDTVFYV